MNILALDIGGTAIKVALVNEKGEILEKSEHPSNGKKGGNHILKTVYDIIYSYENYNKIGISTTGQVNSKTGSIVYANENVPNYTGMEIGKIISKKFNMPVVVENDVNAAALGEAHYGAGKDYKDFLCLTYGTGIGGAIIIDSKIYGGSIGVAGEFGHILTHPDGLPCACGQKGCYEQYASTTALIRECKKINPNLDNGRIIFEEMQGGNMTIKNIIDKWIDEIIIGLVSLIHIFNPNCIILGGGILNQEYIVKEINNKIYDKIMTSYSQVEIKKAKLGNDAGILGVSHLLLNKKTRNKGEV